MDDVDADRLARRVVVVVITTPVRDDDDVDVDVDVDVIIPIARIVAVDTSSVRTNE
jgi:hypothetical protein